MDATAAIALLLGSLLLVRPIAAQTNPESTVDLGYGLYTGLSDNSTGLTVWKGIRYAAPPTGRQRWQLPQPPAMNRTPVIARTVGPACPQAFPNFPSMPFVPGNEDCLFLNVYAPTIALANTSDTAKLPVFVNIHGGGYGLGDGGQDMAALMNSNDNSFVAVSINYRLGAFGFASSPEIKSRGILNAGLMDQNFALQWVQKHISLFGGDSDRVTIGGVSAGAGSVLLHAIAEDGNIGTKLFKNIVAASPWVPTQPNYDNQTPVQHYYDMARLAGCPSSGDVFDCLVGKDSLTLQYAANRVSSTAPTPHGNWAFIPVTDGTYVTQMPSIQLQKKRVNGLRVLIGNNANEGPLLIPRDITTQEELLEWIDVNFVNLSPENITTLLNTYPSSSEPVNPTATKFETDGYGPATAVNVSQVATGQQQRAYNIGAEGAVACVGHWLAAAFTTPGHAAYYYQYSVPFALHGTDSAAYFGPPTENQGPDIVAAFRRIYGNFITKDNPSISNSIANGPSSGKPEAANPAADWPAWTTTNPMMINLNQTGGTPYTSMSSIGMPVTQYRGPGVHNNITIANAYLWEGGRGKRCEVWKTLSPFVPQ